MMQCTIQGGIITPDDIQYEADRQVYNRAIQKYPAAIAYCQHPRDVRQGVLCAQEQGLPIRIRSGGHNYEGYSVGDKAFVIDVSKMNGVCINHRCGTVTLGGGVLLSKLYNTVGSQGYPFPGGTCPTVGVSGFSLGGGWGLSARKFGLGCDSLLEVQMVDGKGHLVTANGHTNPNLFWAMRGAGGSNFGVVTGMTFRLPQRVKGVTYFELYYPCASFQLQMHFLKRFQEWIGSVDPDINAAGGIYNTKADGIYVFMRGICYGDPERTKELLAPFYFTQKLEEKFEYGSFVQIMNQVGSIYPPSEQFKSTGRFVHKTYSQRELYQLLCIVNGNRPRGSVLTSLSFYGLGGKVLAVRPEDTAFYYRDAKYILLIQSVWENSQYRECNQRWVLHNFPVLYRLTKGSYINFPLLQLEDYLQNYFGGNVPRLLKVKKEYDPNNVFSFPQSIPIV